MSRTVLKSDQPSLFELCRTLWWECFDLYSGQSSPTECADALEKLAKKLRAHKAE
jgi:hypothetical protein